MDDATQAAILSTVSGLSDSQLLEQTGKLARLDRQIQAFVIDHLIEIESRKLYLSRGFSSPFDYVTRGLGYSAAAAWRRIGAMNLCAHVEGARERLWDGSLTLDAAAQLQAAFERRDRERARAARRAEASVGAARRRNGSALEAPALVPPPEPKPTPELDVSTRKALVEAAAGKSSRQVIQMLAEMDPELAVPADRVRPLGGERWELKAVIDEECQRGLEQLKGLLSHVDPHMTLGQLVGRLVQEGLNRHDPGRPRRARKSGSRPAGAERTSAPNSDGAATSAAQLETTHADAHSSTAKVQMGPAQGARSARQRPVQSAARGTSTPSAQGKVDDGATSVPTQAVERAGTAASAPNSDRDSDRQAPAATTRPARPACSTTSAPKAGAPAGRAMPAAVEREVWQRDGGRCRYVDPRTGRRCASRHLLQIDHVFPYALGGGAEPKNLRLLCLAHHRHRHAGRASRREPAD